MKRSLSRIIDSVLANLRCGYEYFVIDGGSGDIRCWINSGDLRMREIACTTHSALQRLSRTVCHGFWRAVARTHHATTLAPSAF
jgi:hypothetical protein